MSKAVVYLLDKIVWILLITAVTTQALQIAGVVDTPKGLEDISYRQDNEYNFQVQVGENDFRGKRQADQRSPLIDSLFNIPISTLNAVNNLVQSTRPAFQSLRDYAMREYEKRFLNKDATTTTTTTKKRNPGGKSGKSKSREAKNGKNQTKPVVKEEEEEQVHEVQESRVYPVYVRPREEAVVMENSRNL